MSAEDFKPIETQEAFNAAIKERLARERAKYADYDELKAKAAKLDAQEEAGKDELQKARERISALEAAAKNRAEADRMRELREKVSKETGVPVELIGGTDEESMGESAQAIAAYARSTRPTAPKVPGSGSFADRSAAGTDDALRAFANSLFGGTKS